MKIGSAIIEHFLDGSVDEIRVVYNEFVNVATQMVLTEKLLPIEYETLDMQSTDHLYEPRKEKL
ncbi:MAG: hypothetical protein Ct9H300mP18_11690 [Candidatus Neomarinimicrobiota bacterium]|nr:MAG: hypothetical protein Ct9H300mP18_11690 [Candidatus Neomarinimicrobiota bacterium]